MAEIAQLAAWFHWPLGSLLDMEHGDRQRFVKMIDDANMQEDSHAPV